MKKEYTVVGIETSCDETSVAIYHTTQKLLSLTTYTQIEIHKAFGGVIPEIASRSQLEKISPVFQDALKKASLSLADIAVSSSLPYCIGRTHVCTFSYWIWGVYPIERND